MGREKLVVLIKCLKNLIPSPIKYHRQDPPANYHLITCSSTLHIPVLTFFDKPFFMKYCITYINSCLPSTCWFNRTVSQAERYGPFRGKKSMHGDMKPSEQTYFLYTDSDTQVLCLLCSVKLL